MDYSITGEPNETFETVTLPLRNFVGWAINLPKSANEREELDTNTISYIKSKIGEYLNNPDSLKQLEHWVDLLKKIPNETLEKSFSGVVQGFFDEPDRKEWEVVKDKIEKVKTLITDILQTHKELIQEPKYYFEYLGKPIKLNVLKNKLVKNEMIDDTSYFTEIIQGKHKDKYINWKKSKSCFRYFIEALFETNLFSNKSRKWEIAKNSFTVNGLPIPKNIRTYKNDDVNPVIRTKINVAISYLE